MSIETKIKEITPDVARKYLEKNHPRNRPIQRAKVEEFKDKLRNNTFYTTHQGIGFDEDGYLIDGQKRLTAIVETGISVRMQVTTGLKRRTFEAIDDGQKRDDRDKLYMGGLDIDKEDVATIKTMLGSVSGPKSNVPLEQLRNFYLQHLDAISFVNENIPKRKFPAPIRAAIARAFYTVERSRLEEFCKVLTSGEVSSNGDGAAVKFTTQIANKRHSSAKDRVALYKLSERALIAFAKWETPTNLKPFEKEQFPLPEENEPRRENSTGEETATDENQAEPPTPPAA